MPLSNSDPFADLDDVLDDGLGVKTTSERQIAANRRNAKLSTGPKSASGSWHASFNALRHGLYARDVVFPDEDREAYDELLESMTLDLKPQSQVEANLVHRAADIWWRLGRTAAIEAGFLNPNWSGDPRADRLRTGGGPLIDGFRVAIDDTKTLDRLGRCESRLERAFVRTLGLLKQLQKVRHGGAQNSLASCNEKNADH
jgi:hypothetical protein